MNQTIYFRKEIWDRLKYEPKKSELINRLLEVHYSKINDHIPGTSYKGSDEMPLPGTRARILSRTIIKTPKDAKRAVEEAPGYISKSYSSRKRK